LLLQALAGFKVFRGIINFLIRVESLALDRCCYLHKLAGQPYKVVAQFLDLRCVFRISHTGEVCSASFLLIPPGVEAGDLQNFRQEIDFNEIDENYFSCVEEKFDSKDGVEFECDVSLFVEEVAVEFFEGVDDPVPK
jgi:hypothetical protein